MKLKVLGSGSSGNCYILHNETECLVIEAGVSFMEVKKALDFDIRKIVGVVVSHSHGDHAKFTKDYLSAGIGVFKPYVREECAHLPVHYGGFIIKSVPNQDKDGKWLHGNSDGTECPCYGFYIQHPDIGSLVYATDTEYVRWRFKDVNHVLAEANYSESDFVQKIDDPKRDHVLTGHMSIETCKSFILANKSPALRNICLCHLSAENGDAGRFKQEIKGVVAPDVKVMMAKKGLEANINLCPF